MDRLVTRGWLSGFVGMAIFSGSLPATRLAVAALDPLFVTFARAAIAGVLALAALAIGRAPRPALSDLPQLALVALTMVLGFPLLSALALRSINSAHALVFTALLPLSTAGFAVLRAQERPGLAFWCFALGGAALVAGYALSVERDGRAWLGEGLMVAAVLAGGLGYAEGGRLSRRLGGWQVISWALIISLPAMAQLAFWRAPSDWHGLSWPALAALAYVSVFSMLIGFVFWYRGLALGGIAAVGQLQLLQPFLGLGLAALLLHERVGPRLLLVSAGVVLCVAGAKRFSVAPLTR